MALESMTGFARSEGSFETARWVWELRSVNGKGLDLRLRLPQGLDGLEANVRSLLGKAFSRGNVSVSLQLQREQGSNSLQINENALEQVLGTISALKSRLPNSPEPTLEGIIAHKGVLEFQESEDSPEQREALNAALLASLSSGVDALLEMRRKEGSAIEKVIAGQVEKLAALVKDADELPCRKIETIRARLKQQVNDLLEASAGRLDEQRLHQEVALLATKADVREELDRLYAHIEAAQALIGKGGPVGRRFDFLAQEFNREANTLCSKSNSTELTSIGLELKVLIDQMREQIQNLQ
ncbi:YicC/YloC family endoribonuclease [Flexibacterium corallicola]|uniref:YicC/YloC family endoribonuclease n=1 Tax=Flexibacterium corallicola TaxID=3037259 RepID=UPI00286F9BBB|nr:YicC/YloC family endoribonuclease [Pseudovibrio sp. M1P-2-3]